MIKGIFAFLLLSTCGVATDAQTQPNIILIIADDVGYEDLGCTGNASVKTPNIDKLAREGMRFTNAYVTSSSCSPSRIGIITSRYPHNTGAAELHTPAPAHLPFFPASLKQSGYYTAQLGKWHEGPATKAAYDTLISSVTLNGEGGEDQWISLLRNRPKNKPFFFWLAPSDAHREWQPNSFATPTNPDSVLVPPTLVNTSETRKDLAAYYDEISRLDYYIGELQSAIAEEGIANNTVIIFLSDNGRPFPGSKTRLYDTGVKTPLIIKWPGKVKQELCSSLVSTIDIAPTILYWAGIKPPASFQGRSFNKLLTSPNSEFRHYIFTEHNWHDYEAYERGVRTKEHLYILNLRPQFANQGPLDAVNSPSFKSLTEALAGNKLTDQQKEIFISPRSTEELINDRLHDPQYLKRMAQLRRILKKWQRETGDTAPAHLTPDWYDRQNGKELPAKNKRGEMPGASKQADRINKSGPF